jgi:hypothetical protein
MPLSSSSSRHITTPLLPLLLGIISIHRNTDMLPDTNHHLILTDRHRSHSRRRSSSSSSAHPLPME